jgi:hypothetical protein
MSIVSPDIHKGSRDVLMSIVVQYLLLLILASICYALLIKAHIEQFPRIVWPAVLLSAWLKGGAGVMWYKYTGHYFDFKQPVDLPSLLLVHGISLLCLFTLHWILGKIRTPRADILGVSLGFELPLCAALIITGMLLNVIFAPHF